MRVVKAAVRGGEAVERREHGAARAQVPVAAGLRRPALNPPEPGRHRADLGAGRRGVTKRRQRDRQRFGRMRGTEHASVRAGVGAACRRDERSHGLDVAGRRRRHASFDQQSIKPGDVEQGHDGAAVFEAEERRAQEGQHAVPRAARARHDERQIEQRRPGLGRQGQRVERLIRHAGLAEHLLCEVEIRQRPLKHDRGPRQRGLVTAGRARANHARHSAHFLFAVPVVDQHAVVGFVGHDERRRRTLGDDARIDQLGNLAIDPLAKAGVVRVVGHHVIQPPERRHPSDQIEVGGPEAARIGRMIRHGHHEVIDRPGTRLCQHALPQQVFIDAGEGLQTAFVFLEHAREKRGLPHQFMGAAVVIPIRTRKLRGEYFSKSRHAAAAPAQFVVEIEHGRNQTRADLKWWWRLRSRDPGRAVEEHFALDAADEPRRVNEPGRQIHQPVVARQHRRHDHRRPRLRQSGILDAAAQQLDGAAGGQNQRAAPNVRRRAFESGRNEGVAKGGKIGYADQPATLRHARLRRRYGRSGATVSLMSNAASASLACASRARASAAAAEASRATAS